MRKKTTLLKILTLFLILFSGIAYSRAQVNPEQRATNYSFVTDRKFREVTDLQGWQFVPHMEEIKDVSKIQLRAGDVSFSITRSNLYVQGKGIKGVYSINNIVPTPFGYQLQLMHANDPTLQGHLKVLLCGSYTCNLMFKRSPKDKEVIYHLPEIPKDVQEWEQNFFTDKNEIMVQAADSLFYKETLVKPFLALDAPAQKQIRLQKKDNFSFRFFSKTRLKGKENADSTKNKFVTDFLVSVYTNELGEGSSITEQTQDYKIEKMDWKENTRASPNAEDRFRITLTTKANEVFWVLLNSKKMITYIEFDNVRYAVRGL